MKASELVASQRPLRLAAAVAILVYCMLRLGSLFPGLDYDAGEYFPYTLGTQYPFEWGTRASQSPRVVLPVAHEWLSHGVHKYEYLPFDWNRRCEDIAPKQYAQDIRRRVHQAQPWLSKMASSVCFPQRRA